MKKVLLIIMLLVIFNKVYAVDLASHSKSAILIESSTGNVLFEKKSNEKRSPASMTKIMTLLLTMEALESGKIKLTDEVFISKNASGMGGTQIFAKENTYVTVENLIKGMGIASANDAAVAMSEYIGGSEENFIKMMNDRARDLGCKNTNFMNPHGLDEDNHYTTAYDLSLIAKELVKYQYIIKITSTYEDYINVSGIDHWLVNTNKLVKFYNGIDGLKTGYTDDALYCLTATMNKNDMRLISVVMGVDTKDNRSSDTISLLEYGYSMFGTKTIISKNDYKEEMYIFNSKNRLVNYYLSDDVKLVVDKNRENIEYKIETKLDNIKAPIKSNSKVGTMYLKYDEKVYEYDLVTHEDILKNNYFDVFKNIFYEIISGIKLTI